MSRSRTAPKGKPFNPKDYEKNGISAEQIIQIKEAFDLFDYEGTGVIDSRELQTSMSALGYEAKNQTLFHAVGEFQGSIDFSKFVELLTARSSARDTKQSLRKVFGLFDDAKTGFISIKNLRQVAKEVGENIDESQLQEMIERADLDNDGLISEQEFYAIMTKRSAKA